MTQLLQNAAYGTALILAAAALRRVLKQRFIPEARLALWAVCLLRLLTLAPLESVLSLWGFFRPRQAPAVSAPISTPAPAAGAPPLYTPVQAAPSPVPVVNTPPLYIPVQTVPSPAAPAIPWEKLLLAAWLVVGAVLAVRYVVSWTRTRRAVALTTPVERGSPRYLPLPKCARLREGPMEGAPLTFGAVRPTVVLPPGLEGEALDCVLAHEGVHASRRDNLWHYVMAIALITHWWNPAVWLMARLLRRDIELSCDRAALKKLGVDRRAEYAHTLVSLATQGDGPAFCHTFGRKATEERILYIMKFKKNSIVGLALSLLLVCGVTVAFATEPVEPNPDLAPAVTEPVENSSGAVSDIPIFLEGTVSDLTEEERELVNKMMKISRMKHRELIVELHGVKISSVAQSNCTHPNLKNGKHEVEIWYGNSTATTHEKTRTIYQECPDCYALVGRGTDITVTVEPHSFGPDSYVGSNHSSSDPSQHSFTYSHTCTDCENSFQYTEPSGCRKGNCVDINSVTPEPDVSDAAPDTSVELADRGPYSPDLADLLEDQLKAQMED